MSNAARKLDSGAENFSDLVREVSHLVSQLSGIQLGERQAPMVENRLKTRMLKLGLATPQAYLTYLKEHRESESQALLSLMTTHHTYFFREFSHFEYLQFKVLPVLIEKARARADHKISVWSAACSRGQEIYSLAMFLKFHLANMAPDITFEIIGSDVDPESVKFAANGVYHHNELKEVPVNYMGAHWVRGKGDISDYVKVKDSLKAHCKFQTVNLLNIGSSMGGKKFDFIWCRNVFIYFNQDQIMTCSKSLMSHLYDHGYFFVGISETLTGMALEIQNVGPSIYTHKPLQKAPAKETGKETAKPLGKEKSTAPVFVPNPAAAYDPNYLVKVLCVDDSASILTLLKKVLTKESGFEVVATAMNGKEAADVLKKQKIDLITLDIHMPEVDGLAFLKSYYGPKDPPVVMISSVNRDNADVAVKALELGAFDYIEKPTLSNLTTRGDEIRSKLKSAYYNRKMSEQISTFDKTFKKQMHITEPENKRRIVMAGLSDKKSIIRIMKDLEANHPPQFFFFEGAGEALEPFVKHITQASGHKNVKFVKEAPQTVEVGVCYFADINLMDKVRQYSMGLKTSFIVLGVPTQAIANEVLKWENIHLLIEDQGTQGRNKLLGDICNDFIPVTSYVSISEEFFEGLK